MTGTDLLTISWLGKPLWLWGSLLLIILVLIFLDLGVLNPKHKIMTVKSSLWQSVFYIAVSLAYGAWIWGYLGTQSAHEFLTGYLVEKSLSVDNIFVISLIFSYFQIPLRFQHRVLFLGILGVVILRGIMIAMGAALISRFEWVSYLFAGFLVITGIKMLLITEEERDIEDNPLLKFLRNHLRVTSELHDERFFIRLPLVNEVKKVLWVTPLFLALILVEFADIIFAVDSIPAIFTITRDPFIVYASNIFAIFGLRALYYSLASILHKFIYLKPALALVLLFIGGKVFVAWGFGIEKIPSVLSLLVTAVLIGGGIILSLLKTRQEFD